LLQELELLPRRDTPINFIRDESKCGGYARVSHIPLTEQSSTYINATSIRYYRDNTRRKIKRKKPDGRKPKASDSREPEESVCAE
jgi:hypothetical protein